MGQLEKYGLYVMCLVIFLILGVTLWGEPANATRTAGREQAAMHAGGSVPQDASFQRTSSRPSDLDELLGPPAQQPPRYQRGESSSRQAGSQQAEGRSSSLNDVLKEKVEPVAKPETKAEPVTRPEAALSTVRGCALWWMRRRSPGRSVAVDPRPVTAAIGTGARPSISTPTTNSFGMTAALPRCSSGLKIWSKAMPVLS